MKFPIFESVRSAHYFGISMLWWPSCNLFLLIVNRRHRERRTALAVARGTGRPLLDQRGPLRSRNAADPGRGFGAVCGIARKRKIRLRSADVPAAIRLSP